MLLTIKQAGMKLGYCPKEVRKLMRDGKIAYIPGNNSARGDRIDEPDIQIFIDEFKTRIRKCPSTKGVIGITLPSRLAVDGLEELLARKLRGNKPKNSKQNSGPSLSLV